MRKRILSLLCAAALVAGLSVPAMAAEDSGIKVQLNGQNLTFTDAVPTAKDGRVYLPARVVLEALGATVTADADAGTVTAVRDGKTLTMTIGSTSATLVEGDETATLAMDAAPYVQNNRTYAPIRFAAQAFGCSVGWDGAAQTAVVVDTQKLIADAVADHKYTLLDKVAAYGAKYNTGSWSTNGTVKMDASVLGNSVLTGNFTVDGIVADAGKVQMKMDANMDMTGLYTLLGSMGQDISAVKPADMKLKMDMDMRGDLMSGKLYYLMNGLPESIPGLPAGAWLMMDINEVYRQAGLNADLTELMNSAKSVDLEQTLASTLAAVPVNSSATGYADLTAAVDKAALQLSDAGFQKVSGGYANSYSMTDKGVTVTVDLSVSTNSSDTVTACAENITLSVDVKSLLADIKDESVTALLKTLTDSGINMDTLTATVKATANDSGANTATMGMTLGNLFAFQVDANLKLASTSKIPVLTPPTGATVVNWSDLMPAVPAR